MSTPRPRAPKGCPKTRWSSAPQAHRASKKIQLTLTAEEREALLELVEDLDLPASRVVGAAIVLFLNASRRDGTAHTLARARPEAWPALWVADG